jgi:ribosomal protein S27E
MNVTFRCPHCDNIGDVDFDQSTREIACPHCQAKWPIPPGSTTGGQLAQCLICPSTELFVRKDFSQSLGVTIVVVGAVVSSIFWYLRMPLWTYGVLFATALIDVVLYFTVGNLLQCYRCQAQYRGVPGLEDREPFDLETHEKHRQQKIGLQQAAKAHK